ncbi:tRNA1(Val) (adenine(37)-N6)-methyltransferase [Wenxinia saemankumensis]|uniref:tRNA1(Val) A37 N6-methylase TrmN6 n=1 Tax=Wenxinia saemankumensis TaxID=1447782 RepID=A0A1M6EAA1_9RHOB|nr:methyltransferase [Wenxinia saemankumensis]SHI82208.1 tRNA1(Val) A37 N6-methylase TrmN6 [Wenxinia saemankumensis]
MASTSAAEGGTTRDAFLGGRVMALQPARGFRSGPDAVLLAAAVTARPGETALELGCGAGVAALCLAARVPGLAVTGLEVQPAYAALARANGLDIVEGSVAAMPRALKERRFHHVLANPPWFDRRAGLPSPDAGRDLAFGGPVPLRDWVAAGARRLLPRGTFTLIARIECLPEALSACEGRLGGIAVRPLAGRAGRAPGRFVLRAMREGRGAFRLLPPLVLHEGAAHRSDRDGFAPGVDAILKDGAPFPWTD